MSTYFFETITAAQALAFNGQTDSLFFNDPGASGTNLRVTYNPPSGGGPATLTVLDINDNHIVVFGTGLELAPTAFPASGGWAVTNAAGVEVLGNPAPDGLFGVGGADTLHGQGGDDVLQGGQGADVLDGGAGSDLFLIASGDSPAAAGQMDTLIDWTAADRLSFVFQNGQLLTPNANAVNYVETTAPSFSAALAAANAQIAGGVVEYVAVQVGGDVVVFADDQGDHGTADDAVILKGTTLTDIDASNIVFGVTAPHATFISTPPPVTPPPVTPPVTPPPDTPTFVPGPTPSATQSLVPSLNAPGVDGTIFGNMDSVHLSNLTGAPINTATSTHLALGGGDISFDLFGVGFTYDGNEQLSGGTAQTIFITLPIAGSRDFQSTLDLHHPVSAAPFGGWVATDATQFAFATILAGNDTLSGSSFATPDLIRGYGGNDLIYGDGSGDTLMGGDGDDTIYALTPPGILGDSSSVFPTYLRGEAGNDTITGAEVFDDINGNMGNDVLHGAAGNDWVVGGKDDDLQFGDAGDDVVWGNLGNDTLDGGDGADQVRGGQGDDTLTGGAGNDFVSGDRGNDTITGGTGADLFHGSQDAGIDRVLDFNLAEGDRVMLDPGTIYTLRQEGADTVIDMGTPGNEMILVGVQLSTLTPGWIF